jgi:FKBP-type peptidyl-prolyl cis-trans isomerase 2
MVQAKKGDTVKVHYTGKLDDGTVFDSSVERDPLQFTIGEGQVIPGFEKAVIGMDPGESKTAKLPADEAYGQHREELVAEVEHDKFPGHVKPQVGQQLQIRHPQGQTHVVRVIDVSESKVTLDANHPLAGQDLTFDIQLKEIL